MKKVQEKVFIPEVIEANDDEEDITKDEIDPINKRIQLQKRLEKLKIDSMNSSVPVKETSSAKLPSRLFSGLMKSKVDRTSSLKSATSKKTRTGGFISSLNIRIF